MASQQAAQSGEQKDAISVSPIEPRGEASNRHNSARPQPLSADQKLIDIDQNLLNAYVMLDRARKDLYGYRTTLGDTTQRCSAWEQAYYEEHQKRIMCAGAYAELYDKHDKTVNHLHAVSNQCRSLHRELEYAQTELLAFESTIQGQERSSDGKNTPDTGEGCEVSRLDWDMVEQGIENEQLKARIRELEEEMSQMRREHENALIDAAHQIHVLGQEAEDLAKMRQTASPRKVQQGRRKKSRTVKQEVEPCSP